MSLDTHRKLFDVYLRDNIINLFKIRTLINSELLHFIVLSKNINE